MRSKEVLSCHCTVSECHLLQGALSKMTPTFLLALNYFLLIPDHFWAHYMTAAQDQSPLSGLHLKYMALLSVLFQCTWWYPECATGMSILLTLRYDVIYKLQRTSHR